MKKVATIFIGLILLAITVLSIQGSNVQEIKTEIEISASPEKIWTLLTEINQWHEWSPIINKSNGEASIGSLLDITMIGKEDGTDGPQYNPKVVELKEKKYFRWRAHMMSGFLFSNDKIFQLEKTPTGAKLIHKELFSGLLAPIFCGQMEENVPKMLNSMNQALKELAEK